MCKVVSFRMSIYGAFLFLMVFYNLWVSEGDYGMIRGVFIISDYLEGEYSIHAFWNYLELWWDLKSYASEAEKGRYFYHIYC